MNQISINWKGVDWAVAKEYDCKGMKKNWLSRGEGKGIEVLWKGIDWAKAKERNLK